LRIDKGRGAQVIAVEGKKFEGVRLDLVILLALVQCVEIGDAVHAKDHRFAVDDELLVPVLQRGLDDPRIAL
jgi:hypothetical protein